MKLGSYDEKIYQIDNQIQFDKIFNERNKSIQLKASNSHSPFPYRQSVVLCGQLQ